MGKAQSLSLTHSLKHFLLTLMISDIPKDMEPMKSFREVRSQSQTSISNRRSLSSAFNSLEAHAIIRMVN